jgi:hypothetical protein
VLGTDVGIGKTVVNVIGTWDLHFSTERYKSEGQLHIFISAIKKIKLGGLGFEVFFSHLS